jgi:hypothetical protein
MLTSSLKRANHPDAVKLAAFRRDDAMFLLRRDGHDAPRKAVLLWVSLP